MHDAFKGIFFFIRFVVHTQFEASDPGTNGISSPYKEVEVRDSICAGVSCVVYYSYQNKEIHGVSSGTVSNKTKFTIT